MLKLYLFGTFRAEADSGPIDCFPYDKVRALLAYLALEAEAPVSRRLLATLLWSELPDQAARRNLRQALFHLRKALAAVGARGALEATQTAVQFQPGRAVWVDARAFSACVGSHQGEAAGGASSGNAPIASLREAVALYSGPLLAGLSFPDCEPFEEWLIPTRERYHHQALQAMETLAEYYLRRGEYEVSQRYAQQQIALEPWHEVAHRQLMQALALDGQRSRALATYQRAAEILAEELGVEPDAATRELANRIKSGDLTPVPAEARYHGHPRPYRLPRPLTPFIGRETELEQLASWVRSADHRLISIVGPGGIGKSRLVLAVGANLGAEFRHGVCLVPLGADEAPDVLVMAVATALNLPLHGHAPVREQLGDFLAEKSLLLLLDSFETFADSGSARLVGDLLTYAPALKILVTSRVRLNLPGEWVLSLEGFSVGHAERGHAPGDATRLFELRARQVRPGFAPSPEERDAIRAICRLVEGVPLAIELAASWVRVLRPSEIERELRAESALLLDPAPDDESVETMSLRPLSPLLDGSWRLLSPTEKYVFRRLSIFTGGFDREAAEQVAGASLRELRALIDHSFLRSDNSGRYRIHALLRDYGLRRLGEVPPEVVDVRDRHAHYFGALLAAWRPALRGRQQREALAAIRVEVENVRAAWEWSVAGVRLPALRGALDGLFHFYDIQSWFEEGAARFGAARVALERWLDEGPRPDVTEPQRLLGKLLAREGWFLFHRGEREQALTLLRRSRDLLRTVGAESDLVFTLNYLAAIRYHGGEYERARQLCEEARTLATREGDQYGVAIANNIAGQIAFMKGDYEAAEMYSRRSLAIERRLGNRWSMAFSLYNLGTLMVAQERYEEARQTFEESLAIRREMEDFRGIANCYSRLGETEERLGRPEGARERYNESLDLFRMIGDRWGICATHIKLGRVSLLLGDEGTAEEQLRAALEGAAPLLAKPIFMEGVIEWACLLVTRGEDEEAASLLLFARDHPAASRESRERAARLLAALSETLGPDTVHSWRERGQGHTVESVLADVVGQGGDGVSWLALPSDKKGPTQDG